MGSFTAPISGLYLTVQVDPNANPAWAHVDKFSLTAVPEPASFTLLLALGLAALLGQRAFPTAHLVGRRRGSMPPRLLAYNGPAQSSVFPAGETTSLAG